MARPPRVSSVSQTLSQSQSHTHTGGNIGVRNEGIVIRTATHPYKLVRLLNDIIVEILEQALDHLASITHL